MATSPQGRGKPSLATRWKESMQAVIASEDPLPEGLTVQPPDWWRPGYPLQKPIADADLAETSAASEAYHSAAASCKNQAREGPEEADAAWDAVPPPNDEADVAPKDWDGHPEPETQQNGHSPIQCHIREVSRAAYS